MSDRRTSRKIVTRALVILPLGAIISVAVAWASIVVNDQWRTDLAILQATASFQFMSVPIAPPEGASGSSSAAFPGAAPILGPVNERKRTWCYEVSLSGDSHASRASVRAGWPLLCFQTCEYAGQINQLRQRPISGVMDVLRRTIWLGFAINTVFYAVILWLLFAAPFAMRRRSRIKRGLCLKCGYDLRGSNASACPECGTQAHRMTSAT